MRRCDLRDGERAVRQLAYDGAPGGMREGRERPVERAPAIFNHFVEYSWRATDRHLSSLSRLPQAPDHSRNQVGKALASETAPETTAPIAGRPQTGALGRCGAASHELRGSRTSLVPEPFAARTIAPLVSC